LKARFLAAPSSWMINLLLELHMLITNSAGIFSICIISTLVDIVTVDWRQAVRNGGRWRGTAG
jgi:hypothetical protein